MAEEPDLPGNTGSNTYSTARNLIDGEATTRGNVERVHDETQRTFVASADDTLGSEESLNLQLSNPASSGRSCHFYFGEMTHGDETRISLHTSTDDVADTSPLEAANNYIGSSVESVVDVHSVGSFTSLDTHFEQTYLGSGTESIFDGYRITLPPDESFILEIQNLGGNSAVGTRFAWAESEQLTES